MTVRTGSFDPSQSGFAPASTGLGDRWKQVLLLVAGLVVAGQAVRWLSGWSAAGRAGPAAALAAPAAVPEITFVAQGKGTLTRESGLYSLPAGGELLADLEKGAELSVGGVVDVPAGLGRRQVYWVQFARADGSASTAATHGFVAADAVVVSAGTPLRLSLSGVPAEALGRPSPAVRYAGGEAAVASASSASVAGGTGVTVASEGSTGTASAAGVQGADLPGDFSIGWLPSTISAWRPLILDAAKSHGVDPALVALVMLVESGGGQGAQSPSGAVGLMQVMPSTGAGIAQERGLAGYTPEQLWDPKTNIDFGAYYISQQLGNFGVNDDPDWQQSVELAASAYNGGPGSVQRLLAGGSLPNETVRYRQWVGGMWRERALAASPTYDAWSAAGGAVLVAAAERELASR